MAEKLSNDELRAYFALVSAGDLVQRAVSSQLAEHGLTPLQFSVLAELLEAPDGRRMSELAERLVVSRSGLTYQANQLEKAGLVERTSSASDSRGVIVRSTAAGRERVLAAFPGHLTLVHENFLDLLDTSEITGLRQSLEKIVARLRDNGRPTAYSPTR